MARTENITGGYVRVELRRAGDFGFASIGGITRSNDEMRADLERLATAIRKRVDKFEDERGDVFVEIEREAVCSHCGNCWTEDSTEYNGGCCDADEKHNPIA